MLAATSPLDAPLRVIVNGAGGRMGRTLLAAVLGDRRCRLSGALERAGAEAEGADAGVLAGLPSVGLAVTTDLPAALAAADVVLDFTVPAASVALAAVCAETGVAHVIGTTGFSGADLAAVATSAGRTAIVRSGNMSLGVNLLAALVRQAAAALDQTFDIEIVEMHHRRKVDAPSGTALLLGEAAAAGRGVALEAHAVRSRDGHTGERPAGAIGFATLRGGTVVGDHSVVFAGPGERMVLSHVAEDRGLFAQGALTAALWTRGRPPGLYSIADVLGLPR